MDLISEKELKSICKELEEANEETLERFPGEPDARQPIHTVYGGAHLFKSTTAKRIGEIALASFQAYAPNPSVLAEAVGEPNDKLMATVFERAQKKLASEAVEDFRIDFEDGFGHRSDTEEDEWAINAAREVAKGMAENTLPPFIGIRIKAFSDELKLRSIRTLCLFLETLSNETNGKLPPGFVVTLPKIVNHEQVKALVKVFNLIEERSQIPRQSLKMEFMVETPQSVFSASGHCALPKLVKSAKGRVVAAHFGVYDYTASVNVTAKQQTMTHSSCDFARHVMKVNLSGTGLFLSDGATNVMPVEIYKKPGTETEKEENMRNVHRVWKLNYDHVQRSLSQGFYQGWDLHPAQIPIRYVALFGFFLSGLESASDRLRNFIEQASKATLVGDIFDDAATGQGLLNYFLRAWNCGAIGEQEILSTGLSLEDIRTRSFRALLERKKIQSQ